MTKTSPLAIKNVLDVSLYRISNIHVYCVVLHKVSLITHMQV